LLKYIKKAFLFHWNLLAVATGIAGGIISGRLDVVVPALTALEVIYLAALASHPRFQDAVDAAEQKDAHGRQHASERKLDQMLVTLNRADRRRYEQLKNLCLELRHIATRVKRNTGDIAVISDVQLNSINRLLWIYLKLLYSKNALESFFEAINVKDIQARIERSEQRLKAMGPESNDRDSESLRRKSLKDTLATSRQRLKNYQISTENYDFIGLELERLHAKIASLAEMGISCQDPNLINSEINVVSSSIEKTEKAMNELDFITGVSFQDEEPPALFEERERRVEMKL
jgi:hypothetical protein